MDKYEQKLLTGWEEVFKKGQLTLWILLSLKEDAKHMAEIKSFINVSTNSTITADDQSMYRALRRFYDAEMVSFSKEPGDGGPERKVYCLTPVGEKVLKSFVQRNIIEVYFKPEIRKLLS